MNDINVTTLDIEYDNDKAIVRQNIELTPENYIYYIYYVIFIGFTSMNPVLMFRAKKAFTYR